MGIEQRLSAHMDAYALQLTHLEQSFAQHRNEGADAMMKVSPNAIMESNLQKAEARLAALRQKKKDWEAICMYKDAGSQSWHQCQKLVQDIEDDIQVEEAKIR